MSMSVRCIECGLEWDMDYDPDPCGHPEHEWKLLPTGTALDDMVWINRHHEVCSEF